jgi:CheY-like chemotaxis protein
VLVAEDNTVNQVLILRMLEKLGHTAAVVASGRKVLSVLEEEPFDVVLMDIQMPEMDGFEATAAIRRSEAETPGRRRVPIIALTAHALKGDRERCLAAGMDDYLFKPVKQEDLSMALTGLPGGPAGRLADPHPPFDLSLALRHASGDRDLLREMLVLFAKDYPVRIQTLREAVQRADPEEMTRAAHALKGTLLVLGAATAASLAERLEALAGEGRVEEAGALVRALEGESERVVRYADENPDR